MTTSPNSPIQADVITRKYAPLIGKSQYGDGLATDRLEYWNYGAWADDIDDPHTASARLVEELIQKLPEKPNHVLDVAFGQGGSTRRLCELFGTNAVTGINIAPDQVQRARNAGISCDLIEMDAARMTFRAESFDAILCVEAAFHFDTRLEFLRRAYEALKPGGHLVMSDLLLRSGYGLDPMLFPPQNEVRNTSEYHQVFVDAGFNAGSVEIVVTTATQIGPYFYNLSEIAGYLPIADPEVIQIHEKDRQKLIEFILTRTINISESVNVVARK